MTAAKFIREPISGALWVFRDDNTALRWAGPGYVPQLVLNPLKPGGVFIRIEAPEWDRALDTSSEFKKYARDFFDNASGEG